MTPLTCFETSHTAATDEAAKGLSARAGPNLFRNKCWSGEEGKTLNLWIEIEESVDAHTKLGLDLLSAALEHMHSDMRFIAILQRDRCIAHCRDFICGQQPHSVNQREICHRLNCVTKFRDEDA